MTPGLSVVITAHQRVHRLPRLLDLVLADPASVEVLVVADGCTDGTADYLRRRALDEPRLRPVVLHPNVGQPRARAEGVRQAVRDVVLSLDDDVLPEPGLSAGHAERHARGDVDLVLGLMPTRLPVPRRRGQFATWEYAEAYEEISGLWRLSTAHLLPHLWGGNFSVRRSVYLAAVEGYGFGLEYHEDAELGLRLQAVGCRAAFEPRLVAHHEHARGWNSYLAEARSAGRSRVLLAQEWPCDLPFDASAVLSAASRPVRVVARAARLNIVHLIVVAVLRAVALVAGHLCWWKAEDRTSRLAKFLEGHRAVRLTLEQIDAARST